MSAPGDLVNAPDYALAFRLLEPVPERPQRLLVLLHGVGGNESQMAALGEQAGAETLVVLPRAPRSVGGDMFGWFRVAFTGQGPEIVPEEAEESRLKLIELLRQLQHRHDIDAAHTVVAGFSQGGILSASAALTAPDVVAGFAVLCGRILPELEPQLASRQLLSTLDALIVHGRTDDKLPVAWAERADGWLRRLGIPHELRLHAAGHVLTPGMQADFIGWLDASRQRWNQ